MKKTVICLLTAAVLCVGQVPVVMAQSDQSTVKPIVITELQTGGATDATAEFVELYNPNDTSIDVTGWQLQYRPASGTVTGLAGYKHQSYPRLPCQQRSRLHGQH